MRLWDLFRITTIFCIFLAVLHRPLGYMVGQVDITRVDAKCFWAFVEPLRLVAWLFHLEWQDHFSKPHNNGLHALCMIVGIFFWIGVFCVACGTAEFWIKRNDKV